MLESVYPDHEWNPKLFLHTKKVQKILYNMVKKLFPKEDILEDYRHPDLRYSSNSRMELDIYLPGKNLAFEYNGYEMSLYSAFSCSYLTTPTRKQHYESNFVFGSHEIQRERDMMKIDACRARGITLIEIPYWWNQSEASLVSTIAHQRSDLASSLPSYDPTVPPIQEAPTVTASAEKEHFLSAAIIEPYRTWDASNRAAGMYVSEYLSLPPYPHSIPLTLSYSTTLFACLIALLV